MGATTTAPGVAFAVSRSRVSATVPSSATARPAASRPPGKQPRRRSSAKRWAVSYSGPSATR